MKKSKESITFSCPECKKTFEFDNVEDYQLVPCPICGVDYVTIKKNQTLTLQYFEQLDQGCNL